MIWVDIDIDMDGRMDGWTDGRMDGFPWLMCIVKFVAALALWIHYWCPQEWSDAQGSRNPMLGSRQTHQIIQSLRVATVIVELFRGRSMLRSMFHSNSPVWSLGSPRVCAGSSRIRILWVPEALCAQLILGHGLKSSENYVEPAVTHRYRFPTPTIVELVFP